MEKRLGEIRSREIENAVKSPTSFSPPSGPLQWLFQGPPAENKFLAVFVKLIYTLVFVFAFLFLGCGETDGDDPKSLEKIVERALDGDKIQKRLNNGILLLFAPNSETPYTGWVKWLHSNGKVGELMFVKDGLLGGRTIEWYDNGQKESEGNYPNGIRQGQFTLWYESGQKKAEVTYDNGKKNGVETQWWDHGVKQMVLNWENGVINGQFINWFSNGNKRVETNFKNGAPDGLSSRWHLDGQKLWDIQLTNGKVVSEKYWNEEGQIVDSATKTGFSSFDDELYPEWVTNSSIRDPN